MVQTQRSNPNHPSSIYSSVEKHSSKPGSWLLCHHEQNVFYSPPAVPPCQWISSKALSWVKDSCSLMSLLYVLFVFLLIHPVSGQTENSGQPLMVLYYLLSYHYWYGCESICKCSGKALEFWQAFVRMINSSAGNPRNIAGSPNWGQPQQLDVFHNDQHGFCIHIHISLCWETIETELHVTLQKIWGYASTLLP
jgi:hypothetical protein